MATEFTRHFSSIALTVPKPRIMSRRFQNTCVALRWGCSGSYDRCILQSLPSEIKSLFIGIFTIRREFNELIVILWNIMKEYRHNDPPDYDADQLQTRGDVPIAM